MGFEEVYTDTTDAEAGKKVLTDDAYALTQAIWVLIRTLGREGKS